MARPRLRSAPSGLLKKVTFGFKDLIVNSVESWCGTKLDHEVLHRLSSARGPLPARCTTESQVTESAPHSSRVFEDLLYSTIDLPFRLKAEFAVLQNSKFMSERELSLLATFAEPSDDPDPYDASVTAVLPRWRTWTNSQWMCRRSLGAGGCPSSLAVLSWRLGLASASTVARGFSGETRENCSFSQSVIELNEAITKPVS